MILAQAQFDYLAAAQQNINYLTFKKDDYFVIYHQYENGWWYGQQLENRIQKFEAEQILLFKDIENLLKGEVGFLPSNYLKYKAEIYQNDNEEDKSQKESFNQIQQSEDQQGIVNQNKKVKIKSSLFQIIQSLKKIDKMRDVSKKFLKGQIKLDEILQESEYKNNKMGILGYKKQQVNVNKIVADKILNKNLKIQQTVEIAIKDQCPIAKDVRHMNYYFDYDNWVDQKNLKQFKKKKQKFKSKKEKKKLYELKLK